MTHMQAGRSIINTSALGKTKNYESACLFALQCFFGFALYLVVSMRWTSFRAHSHLNSWFIRLHNIAVEMFQNWLLVH